MPDPSPDAPLEPWVGYAAMDAKDRLALYTAKHDEAAARFDQPYAVALAAAVHDYERLRELAPDLHHDEQVKRAARNLHSDAGSWKPN